MWNDKCVTKEANKLAQFICASKQLFETEYIHTLRLSIHTFRRMKSGKTHPKNIADVFGHVKARSHCG